MKNNDVHYPVKILSFEGDEENTLMIKYQYSNKRVADVISLNTFLNSPLVHATHPVQLYYLGFDACNSLSQLKNPLTKKDIAVSKGLMGRFKRIFIHG